MGNHHDKDAVICSLWNAIFAGTRIRHVGDDRREYVLRSIIWGQQERKVVDVETGEVFRFPWTELDFIDPVEGNLPEWPPAPEPAKNQYP